MVAFGSVELLRRLLAASDPRNAPPFGPGGYTDYDPTAGMLPPIATSGPVIGSAQDPQRQVAGRGDYLSSLPQDHPDRLAALGGAAPQASGGGGGGSGRTRGDYLSMLPQGHPDREAALGGPPRPQVPEAEGIDIQALIDKLAGPAPGPIDIAGALAPFGTAQENINQFADAEAQGIQQGGEKLLQDFAAMQQAQQAEAARAQQAMATQLGHHQQNVSGFLDQGLGDLAAQGVDPGAEFQQEAAMLQGAIQGIGASQQDYANRMSSNIEQGTQTRVADQKAAVEEGLQILGQNRSKALQNLEQARAAAEMELQQLQQDREGDYHERRMRAFEQALGLVDRSQEAALKQAQAREASNPIGQVRDRYRGRTDDFAQALLGYLDEIEDGTPFETVLSHVAANKETLEEYGVPTSELVKQLREAMKPAELAPETQQALGVDPLQLFMQAFA